ncbi:hypothetical protein LguiA_002713 [Lonicera macranthoides]
MNVTITMMMIIIKIVVVIIRAMEEVKMRVVVLRRLESVGFVKKKMKRRIWSLLVLVMALSSLRIGSAFRGGATKRATSPVKFATRQAWGPHIDLRDPHFLAFAAAERQFLQSEYEEYAAANSGTVASDANIAFTPSFNGHKRLWYGAGGFIIPQSPDIHSSASGFSFAVLCDGPFMVPYAKPKEEAVHILTWCLTMGEGEGNRVKSLIKLQHSWMEAELDFLMEDQVSAKNGSQTQGSHDFGQSSMLGGYLHPNLDCQTQGTHGFGHQNVGEGFWQPNMVGGYGAMLQHFNIGNGKQPFFYDQAAKNPTMNTSLSNDKD